jgi:hypothetical protein
MHPLNTILKCIKMTYYSDTRDFYNFCSEQSDKIKKYNKVFYEAKTMYPYVHNLYSKNQNIPYDILARFVKAGNAYENVDTFLLDIDLRDRTTNIQNFRQLLKCIEKRLGKTFQELTQEELDKQKELALKEIEDRKKKILEDSLKKRAQKLKDAEDRTKRRYEYIAHLKKKISPKTISPKTILKYFF